tara:strand:- start:322 stop:1128 length:807 start_codon:yes stop_codon:yes gene_type:complete
VSKLTYITSARCGWCRKADPIIEELQESGLEITVLDVTVPEQKELATSIKKTHNASCGTPLFIDAESGNMVCGFSEERIRKWAAGEKIEAVRKTDEKSKAKPTPIEEKGRDHISLKEDAEIEIVENSPDWWMKIAHLRSLRAVQKGFIKRLYDFIVFPSQAQHMGQYEKNYIIAKSGNLFLGYARCIDGDIGICVYPELQGRGIASMLLEELLKRYPDAHARVKVDNAPSKKLFEKFGFVVKDTVEVDCLHGIIFEKVLVMKRETQPV